MRRSYWDLRESVEPRRLVLGFVDSTRCFLVGGIFRIYLVQEQAPCLGVLFLQREADEKLVGAACGLQKRLLLLGVTAAPLAAYKLGVFSPCNTMLRDSRQRESSVIRKIVRKQLGERWDSHEIQLRPRPSKFADSHSAVTYLSCRSFKNDVVRYYVNV